MKNVKTQVLFNRVKTMAYGLYVALPKSISNMWRLTKVLENLQDFVVDGEAVDHEWLIKNRNLLEDYAILEMRDQGWIPVLDMSPGLSFEYDESKEIFKYQVVIKGLKKVNGPVTELGILATKGIVIDSNNCWIPLVDAEIV